jgi:putative ABC transport system substrate-binding protein
VKRRTFIVQGFGAALSLPLRAYAQSSRLPIIGFLGVGTVDDGIALTDAFRTGLAEGGYVDGRDIAIDYRWANGRPERLRGLAVELANRPVRVIATAGGRASAEAALDATSSLPVLFTDVSELDVRSLSSGQVARGANLTGAIVSAQPPGSRRLELLRAISPGVRRIGYLHDGSGSETAEEMALRAACVEAGVTLLSIAPRNLAGVEAAFAAWREQKADGLIVAEPLPPGVNRGAVVALATRYALPACYGRREFAVRGGLMSFGLDLAPGYRHAGLYAAKILQGAQMRDLPLIEFSRVELVINLATARQIGLAVPHMLRAAANELLE